MIRVCVYLLSAISPDRSRELARLDIWNDGETTADNDRRGTYHAQSYRGRSTEELDKAIPMKRASVGNWPRHDLHIWNLVRLTLEFMGYTNTRASVAPRSIAEAVPVLAGYRRPLRLPASVGDTWAYCADPSREPDPEGWEPVYAFTSPED